MNPPRGRAPSQEITGEVRSPEHLAPETLDLTSETAELLPVEFSALEENSTQEDCLIVIKGVELSRCYPLYREVTLIGRSSGCDLRLDQPDVSRQHCRLVRTGDLVMLQDLESKNKTRVNNIQVTEHLLADGDQIRIGGVVLKYLRGQNLEARYHEELVDRANLDPLTGAYNRRFFWDFLNREVERCARYGGGLSLVMLDIDHFKAANDLHGHLAGDRVLRELVRLVRGNLRQVDLLVRFGGEEFLMVLPGVDLAGAVACAEKIRALVAQSVFSYKEARIPVTISLGVASLGPDVTGATELVELVDHRLLMAKRAGRNQVIAANPVPASQSS